MTKVLSMTFFENVLNDNLLDAAFVAACTPFHFRPAAKNVWPHIAAYLKAPAPDAELAKRILWTIWEVHNTCEIQFGNELVRLVTNQGGTKIEISRSISLLVIRVRFSKASSERARIIRDAAVEAGIQFK